MPQIDIEASLRDGYSPTEILDGLNAAGYLKKWDIAASRKDGYSDDEILTGLTPVIGYVAPEPQEEPGFLSNIGTLAKSGYESASESVRAQIGGDEDIARITAERNRRMAGEYQPPELLEVKSSFKDEAALMENGGAWNTTKGIAGSVVEIGKQVLTNPKGVAYLGAEQAANMAAIIAGRYPGVVGGAAVGATVPLPGATVAGGLIGGALTGGTTEYALEAGGATMEGLARRAQAAGVDTKDEDAIREFIQSNPQALAESKEEGAKKGFWTALVDQAMMGVSGRIASAPARAAQKEAAAQIVGTNIKLLADKAIAKTVANKADEILKATSLTQRAKHLGFATGNEMLGGMGSEAAGQYAAYDKLDWNEIALEGLGELVTGPVEAVAVGRDYTRDMRNLRGQQAPTTDPAAIADTIMRTKQTGDMDVDVDAAIAAMDGLLNDPVLTNDVSRETTPPAEPPGGGGMSSADRYWQSRSDSQLSVQAGMNDGSQITQAAQAEVARRKQQMPDAQLRQTPTESTAQPAGLFPSTADQAAPPIQTAPVSTQALAQPLQTPQASPSPAQPTIEAQNGTIPVSMATDGRLPAASPEAGGNLAPGGNATSILRPDTGVVPGATGSPAAPVADIGQGQPVAGDEAVVPDQPAAPLTTQTPEPIPVSKIDPLKRNEVVLQNRDRSSPELIQQMQGIASNPDASRLSFSRDAANGAPVVFDTVPVSAVIGKTDHVVTSSGRKLPVQYAVVEAGDIVASHTISGQSNQAYSADTPAMRVIGGNGRVAGLQEAFRLGTTKDYVNGISEDSGLHGISAEQIASFKQPVLVRIMSNGDVTANIGDDLNGRMNMELSAVEQAKTDARRLNLETLKFGEDGSLTHDAVKQFVLAMPENERAGLMDKGLPGQRAVDRVMAAMFHQAYGDEELVRIYAQATDIEAKAIINALASAAPSMARLQGADLDVRSIVSDAAKSVINAKRKGVSLADFARQTDMTVGQHAQWMIGYFAEHVRSPKHITEMLNTLAKRAYDESNKPAMDMFGTAPKSNVDDLLKEQGYEPRTEQGNGQRGRREPVDGARRGEGNEQAGRDEAQAGEGAAQPTQDYGDLLSSYSAEELKERKAQLDAIEKEKAKLEAKLIKEEKDRLEHEDIKRRSVAAAKTFTLGGDAATNLSGQNSLFQKAKHYDPNQLIIKLNDQPLRHGDDTEQTRVDRAGLAANALLRGSRGSLLGLSLATDWIAGKGSTLLGQRVTSPQDLAALGAVLRDPRAETFRYFLIKEGKVVYHTAISSRLVGSTAAFIGEPEAFLAELKATMKTAGADGYYLMHNHPSRLVQASRADISTTEHIANTLPGFLGHVILDHTEFGLIEVTHDVSQKQPKRAYDAGAQPLNVTGQDPTRTTPIPHAELDKAINSPQALAVVADAVRQPDNIVLVAVDMQMHVTGVMQVGREDMKKGGLSSLKIMARLRKTAGANEIFAILPEGMKFDEMPPIITKNGWLLDVHIAVAGNGVSAVNENLMAYQRGGARRKDRIGMAVDQPYANYQADLFSRLEEAKNEEIAIAERTNSPQMDMFASIYMEKKMRAAHDKSQAKNAERMAQMIAEIEAETVPTEDALVPAEKEAAPVSDLFNQPEAEEDLLDLIPKSKKKAGYHIVFNGRTVNSRNALIAANQRIERMQSLKTCLG